MKFRQLSEKWLENVKYKVATTTFFHYYQILNWYLYPEFEKLSVNRINQQQIVDFYIKLQTKISKKTHKPYSQSVITMIHDVFYSVMKYGRDSLGIHCILPELFHVRRDFDEEKPVLFFMDDEIGKLIKRIYEMKGRGNLFLKLGILMALFHGLRIGEVCGLKWDDIDGRLIILHQPAKRLSQGLERSVP